jgi:hypothetical protein
MKKLLVGLLALGSISSFASDCEIQLRGMNLSDKNHASKVERILTKKGYTLMESSNLVMGVGYSDYVKKKEIMGGMQEKAITYVQGEATLSNNVDEVVYRTQSKLARINYIADYGQQMVRLGEKNTRKRNKLMINAIGKMPACK